VPTDALRFTRRTLLQSVLLSACAPVMKHAPEPSALDAWISAQRLRSMSHLLANILPRAPVQKNIETKYIAADRVETANMAAHGSNAMIAFDGDRFTQRIVAARGAIAAAAPSPPQEPDYYFHWLRDSSLIVRTIADTIDPNSPLARDVVRRIAIDFVNFTRQIQRVAEPVGLGEPRFNMDGSLDVLKWSRPQNDGPALRALSLRRLRSLNLDDYVRHDLEEAIRIDLDFVAGNAQRTGFDLWEEYDGHDYHTRIVQLAALRTGPSNDQRYSRVADSLARELDTHWQSDQGYFGFFDGPKTYWTGEQRDKPGENLDIGVIIGVVHAELGQGPHSPLDQRVQRTAVALEKFFEKALPINRTRAAGEGVLFGRYANDTYYGDNAYVMLSLEFAQFYYRCAEAMTKSSSKPDREFAQRVAMRNGDLVRGLIEKGDAILRHIQAFSSPSGALPEQFDGNSGAAVSCSDLSWSHAAFLAATVARRRAQIAIS
jgi:glucoamylase